MTSTSLLLRGASLPDGRVGDVLVAGGEVRAIGSNAIDTPAGATPGEPVETVDLTGFLLLPAPAEPHAHLDKALTAHLVPNPSGSLEGACEAWLPFRAAQRAGDIVPRARAAARTALANGTTAVRSHVDIGEGIGLRGLEALLQVRDELADTMHLQLVAFTSAPLTGRDGNENRSQLREAMRQGADVVGACPQRQPDPAGSQRVCLEIAAEFEAPVDLHTDETLDTDSLTIATLADLVIDSGFPYGVVASHCVSLGMTPLSVTRRVAARVAQAGIAVVCCPATNLYLQGRARPSAMPRGLTAVHELRRAGVTVTGGGDNVQDPFNAMGRGDPMDTAALLVLAGHLTPADAYRAVSAHARSALGLPAADLRPGSPAELLAIRATSVADAVANASPERVVVHRGAVVARSALSREFPVLDRHAGDAAAQPPRGWLRRGAVRTGTPQDEGSRV